MSPRHARLDPRAVRAERNAGKKARRSKWGAQPAHVTTAPSAGPIGPWQYGQRSPARPSETRSMCTSEG